MPDGLSIEEIEDRIALIRQNLDELGEQAAGFSGAADDQRTSERIADQQEELDKLIELRDAYLAKKS